MEKAIQRLAYTRSVEADERAEVEEADIELKASAEWQYRERRIQYLKIAQADVADAEADVRKQAMGVFAETGDKAPHPAVKIKIYTMLEYKAEDAINYAHEHLPGALKLDRRVFAKAAKAVAMNFVAILQEPRATIARDLSGYLPKE